jgi:FAD/FMN-containing dehydrogenase
MNMRDAESSHDAAAAARKNLLRPNRTPRQSHAADVALSYLVDHARRTSRLRQDVDGDGCGVLVNDVHSRLNPTRVAEIAEPDSVEALQALVRRARREHLKICIAGGRHAMGGQQFGAGCVLLDTRRMSGVLDFDPARARVEVGAGIQWTELINFMVEAQRGAHRQVCIRQKQTGADRLSVGGALAANIHGRGLRLKPFIYDVESFTLVDAEGTLRECSRTENRELFQLVAGGYGLFGVVASVRLRLAPRRKLERVVRVIESRKLVRAFDERTGEGYLYGDFQFKTDREAQGFMREGIFSCYRPAPADACVPEDQRELSAADWRELLFLAHTDRRRAFDVYAAHYLATSGQLYWSDTHQLGVYLDDYHRDLDERTNARVPASEMISELYVPRAALAPLLEAVRADFVRHNVELIYGTIRLIERDGESFLAWAREAYACVVFNLHVEHDAAGVEKARRDFRRLIARAVELGGSFYLTYHRWATREQVLSCYPQMPEFLRLKRRYDPSEMFESDWYRHYREMFADELAYSDSNSKRGS